jgi:hypothetical protein
MTSRDPGDEDEDLAGYEEPDESDTDDSDQPELVPCPYCHKMVSEAAERCHHCGSYNSLEDSTRRIPWWFLAGVILAGAVVAMWVFR